MPPKPSHEPPEQPSSSAPADSAAASSGRCPTAEGSLFRRLTELAVLFFRIGSTSFGGPAVYIAIMEEETVRRRAWLSHQRFADLVGVTNLIPGPNATEVALHIGCQRAGALGMLVVALAYITPSAVISGLLAWGYVRYGALPAVAPLLAGIQPAVIAILAGALLRLLPSALCGPQQWLIAAAVVAAGLAGCDEVATFFVAAVLGALLIYATRGTSRSDSGAERREDGVGSPPDADGRSPGCAPMAMASAALLRANAHPACCATVEGAAGRAAEGAIGEASGMGTVVEALNASAEISATSATTGSAATTAAATAAAAVPLASGVGVVSAAQVWWFFLKIGAVLYGSGYVIAAYIQGELTAPPWNLSTQQVLDALAAGQITPGPFVSTAAFVGYLLCGWPGVLAATVAINTPALLLVGLTHRWIERCRRWRWTAGALDAVNAAALGLMAAVCLRLGAAALGGAAPAAIFAVASALSLRWRVGPIWLVVGGAVAGVLIFR